MIFDTSNGSNVLDENQIKNIIQENDFFWDCTIDDFYQYKLEREQKRFDDEVLRIDILKSKGLKKEKVVLFGYETLQDLEIDESHYFPFVAIDKQLSHTTNNQNKIDILYKIILDKRDYGYNVSYLQEHQGESILLKQVNEDYKNGFNYPLRHYYNHVIDAFKHMLRENGWRYLKQEKTIRFKNYDGGFSNEEIGIEVYQELIEQIQELIQNIEIERYCIKKLAEINVLSITETEPTELKKIKWLGTPSQFGFIMERLITNGFIENPYPKSFEKNATNFLQMFEIQGLKGETTIGTLTKELSPQGNSLTMDKQRLFRIPRIEEVK